MDSDAVHYGQLTGATDTDYFYFFCPKCRDTSILQILDYKIILDVPVEYFKEDRPRANRDFTIAFELLCPHCKLHDFVKISNIGWQVGSLKDSINFLKPTVTPVIMNTENGTTLSASATLPPDIFNIEKDERDLSATKIILDGHESLRMIEDELPQALRPLLDGKTKKSLFKKGPNYIFINSNIYGSPIGGSQHSVDMRFYNKWYEIKDTIDISAITSELETLIGELMSKASIPEHYEYVGELKIAEEELKKANGPGMLQHIKEGLRDWSLDIAKGIGVSNILYLLTLL